jgi:LTXXQ motif family protein
MHGPDAGMMRHRGGWGYSDPAGYLTALKADLGITPAQEPAWKEYADTVTGVVEQMQGVHQTMYEAMGTATWQERRDMMNRMFDARQQGFDTVHAAAEKLMASLDTSQRTKAATRLPGLAGPGRSMMGR